MVKYSGQSYGYYTPESFWRRNKPAIVVGAVIGLCCGTYSYQWIGERLAEQGDRSLSDQVQQNLVNSLENMKAGRWWVMVTSSFAHVNLLHLGLNMWCLWGFGKSFVAVFGVPHFVGLWMFSAASCSAAQIYWEKTRERLRMELSGRQWDRAPDLSILGIPISRARAQAITGGSGSLGLRYGGSVGASGVACGVTGLFLCFVPGMRVRVLVLQMPLWLCESIWVVGSVFGMATGSLPFIGHAGHLGGTAMGVAYYYGMARPWLRRVGRF